MRLRNPGKLSRRTASVSKRERIKAVTLDLWGTLLVDSPASDDRYKRQRLAGIEAVLKTGGVGVALRDLDRAYDEGGRRLARIWQTWRDVPLSQHVRTLLEELDPDLPGRLAPEIVEALSHAYASPALVVPPAPDDGARSALESLARRGLALGVVSNTMRTPGDVLRQILERFGLLRYFGVLTFSDECGIRKPDPEIFLLTLRQMNVSPEAAVHVGDDLVLDVEGARDAGLRVIRVSGDGRAAGPVKPDAVISRLAELPAALDGLAQCFPA